MLSKEEPKAAEDSGLLITDVSKTTSRRRYAPPSAVLVVSEFARFADAISSRWRWAVIPWEAIWKMLNNDMVLGFGFWSWVLGLWSLVFELCALCFVLCALNGL